MMKIPGKARELGCKLSQSAPILAAQNWRNKLTTNSFLVQLALTLLYRICLDVIYILFLSPIYGYAGFTTNITPLYYLSTWVALLPFLPFIVELNNRRTPSSMLVTVLHYLFFLPFTCYCGCYSATPAFFFIGLVYWGFLLFFQFHIPAFTLRKPHVKHIRLIMMALTIGTCLIVMYVSGRYTGFRFTLNFLDVYGIRAEASTYDIPRILDYALGMMPITMSILLVFWIQQKRYLLSAVLCVVYLFLFSITAQKSIFFFLFLILGCWFFYRSWMYKWAPCLWILALVGVSLEKILIGSYYLLALLVQRMLMLPVQICEEYYMFFSENPLNLFREGIMGKLGFDELYSIRIPRIMGEFRGHEAEGANGGLLADMFYNTPLLPGIVLMPLILVVCFRLLDMTAIKIPEKLRFPIAFYFSTMFMSGCWSTVILSGGVLLACILLYFFPSEEDPNGEVLRT